MKVDLPAVVVDQRIWDETHVLQLGEKIEQRIAWFGNEDFVTGIAEQTKSKRISFAGAGGEDERFRIDGWSVIMRNRFACGKQALGLGIIVKRSRIAEGIENGGFVVFNFRAGGIGNG